jgi:acyl-CoA thioester hydrolase
VSAPERPERPEGSGRPRRADYVAWRTATTRWADDDVYGHMNNAAYFELIDTAVNAHLVEATGTDVRTLPAIGVVAEVSCRYFAEMRFPRPVELGLVAERVGRSSIVYRIGLFQGEGDDACAEGRFVHVYVAQGAGEGHPGHPAGPRPVVPIPEAIRVVAEGLLAPEPA